ncbi:hypothetical protein HpHA116_12430 [Helicobacter pylori]
MKIAPKNKVLAEKIKTGKPSNNATKLPIVPGAFLEYPLKKRVRKHVRRLNLSNHCLKFFFKSWHFSILFALKSDFLKQ